MADSDLTLNENDSSHSNPSEEEFLTGALGGFGSPNNHCPRDNAPKPSHYRPAKNYHNSWWSYIISISLVVLVVIALYYLNTDTATEDYRMRYKILTALIVVLALLHVLISAY